MLVCERIDDWRELANYFGIPPSERRRFARGYEADEIWEWLDYRSRLHELGPALAALGRHDLERLLLDTDEEADRPPRRPEVRRRTASGLEVRRRTVWRRAVAIAGVVVLLAVFLVADRPIVPPSGSDVCMPRHGPAPGTWLAERARNPSNNRWVNEDVDLSDRLFVKSLVVTPMFCPLRNPVYAEYILGGSFRRLRTAVAIRSTAPPDAAATFVVYFDRQRVYAVRVRHGAKPAPIDLAIAGTSRLRIEVQQYQYCGAFYVWAEPTISAQG